jgi:hypothetical protein
VLGEPTDLAEPAHELVDREHAHEPFALGGVGVITVEERVEPRLVVEGEDGNVPRAVTLSLIGPVDNRRELADCGSTIT